MIRCSRRTFLALSGGVLLACPDLATHGAAAQGASDAAATPYAPVIDPANFVARIDNPYMPLEPGTSFVYEGSSGGAAQRNLVEVTRETRRILGVTCIVVRDRVEEAGTPVEETDDWYAQDRDGNVWYFGEASTEYSHGKPGSTAGSWEAGVDGAQPGIVMPAKPAVGETYRQEYLPGEAEDMASVIKTGETLSVRAGSYTDAIVTREWSPLEPGVEEQKSYAPGVGMVLAVTTKGGRERFELTEIRHGAPATPAGTPSA